MGFAETTTTFSCVIVNMSCIEMVTFIIYYNYFHIVSYWSHR